MLDVSQHDSSAEFNFELGYDLLPTTYIITCLIQLS